MSHWLQFTEAAAQFMRANREILINRLSNECPIHERCPKHEFFHGGEAEELREKLERAIEGRSKVSTRRIQHILDEVDARDSLAFCEAQGDANALKTEALGATNG